MVRIFISYSRTDENFVRGLATALVKKRAKIWLDIQDIPPGENWSNAIQEGLDQCQIMILVMTPESMASRHVEAEWQYFLDKGKPVIPIQLKPVESIHFHLNRKQYIDFYQTDRQEAFRQLVFAVLGAVDSSSDKVSAAPLRSARFPHNRRAFWVIAILCLIIIIGMTLWALGFANTSPQDTVQVQNNTRTMSPSPAQTAITESAITGTAIIENTIPAAYAVSTFPPETQAVIDLTAMVSAQSGSIALMSSPAHAITNTPTVASTSTPSPTYTRMPTIDFSATQYFATYYVAQARVLQTETATQWTPTPSNTLLPTPTYTPSLTFTPDTRPAVPISVEMQSDVQAVGVGGSVVWTAYIQNEGDTPISNVFIRSSVPQTLYINSVTIDQGEVIVEGQLVTASVGDLAPEQVVTLTIDTTVASDAPTPSAIILSVCASPEGKRQKCSAHTISTGPDVGWLPDTGGGGIFGLTITRCPSMVDCLLENPDLTLFMDLLLTDPRFFAPFLEGDLTLFVPSNTALQNMAEIQSSDTAWVMEILDSHLVKEVLELESLSEPIVVTSAAGSQLSITRETDTELLVNGVPIQHVSIAPDGRIYVIESVLPLPADER